MTYSRYGYLYLIHEKSQSLDVFKTFKAKVKLQLGKKIKVVKSDRGSEYMADVMDRENNVQDLLRFSLKSVELFHNTLCRENLAWMV